MRILIIEDDKNLCHIMRAGLQDAGIDSDFCHDGETGLELLLITVMMLVAWTGCFLRWMA